MSDIKQGGLNLSVSSRKGWVARSLMLSLLILTTLILSSCLNPKVKKIELDEGWFKLAQENREVYCMTETDMRKLMAEYVVLKHAR